MPLQNRVTPFGEIVAVPERGLFTGNRGIIHDPATRTLLNRRWTTKAWITCVCEFRGRRREVMAQRGWTELFFLDEATALAAGHRPCFYCRRADAVRFRDAWAAGNGIARPLAPVMDATLHAERLERRAKRRHPLPRSLGELPDGTMVAADGEAFLVNRGRLLRWSPAGYRPADPLPICQAMITPPSTVAALAAGYRPVLHPSAAAAGIGP
ncbi:hypothetical protein GCM10017083_22670 [Thalassobaculum fulvum]|uniref:Uncharacterized protein n=1 Tax=Thalassobaculum fulvum TaxID=1633335 RepID=A0A919CPF5_9PROT|nr:hypothetical protein [Thalassobaculum fulvum]GHD49843.1 hypothetical protein GCM10017083_22670 [Thalassobaculum fulvum]